MKTEIEAKFKISEKDIDPIITKLKQLKAKYKYERFEINRFFDKKNFHRKNNEVLRVRECKYSEGSTETFVTFKKKENKKYNDSLKRQTEIEFKVDNVENFIHVLNALGYKQSALFEKKRITFELNDCLVEIDQVPQLGTFCEIEGSQKNKILEIVKLLGYSKDDFLTKGYFTLITNLLNKKDFNLRFKK